MTRYAMNDECINFRDEQEQPKKRDDFLNREPKDDGELDMSYIDMQVKG